MADLSVLAKRMRDTAEKLPGRVSKIAAAVADEVMQVLEAPPPEGTPVDTSKALSNFQVGLGSPVDDVIGPIVPGEKGSTQAASSAAALAIAAEILAVKKPGETIYISNALPYIRRLNDEGYSPQSDHFVERAVAAGRTFLATARGRLFKD
jgi:hypothetical protein